MNKNYNIKYLKILIKFLNDSNIYSKIYLNNLLNRKKRLITKLKDINKNIDNIIFHIKVVYYQNNFKINNKLYKYLKFYISIQRYIIEELDKINNKEIYIMNKFNIKKSYLHNYFIILKKKIHYII